MQVNFHFLCTEYSTDFKTKKRDGICQIDITEIADKDAPIAIIETFANKDIREYRWWQGKLWYSKKIDSWQEEPLPVLSPEMDVKGNEYLTYNEFCKKLGNYQDYLVLINGITHFPLEEPRILIWVQGNTVWTRRAFHYCPDILRDNYCRVDDYTSVNTKIKLKAAKISNAEIYQEWHHEVLIPEAIQLNPLID